MKNMAVQQKAAMRQQWVGCSSLAAGRQPVTLCRYHWVQCRRMQQRQTAVAAEPAAVVAAAAAAWQVAAVPSAVALPVAELAAVVADDAPAWTLDQAVGLVFGGLLLVLYLSSTKVDEFVARQQRRQLGLCEQCGGLFEPGSCTQKNCPARSGARQ
jgi:hypothetical protein